MLNGFCHFVGSRKTCDGNVKGDIDGLMTIEVAQSLVMRCIPSDNNAS